MRIQAQRAAKPDAVIQHYQLCAAWSYTKKYVTKPSTGQHLYTLRSTGLITILRTRYTLYDASGRIFLSLVQDHSLWSHVFGLFAGPRRLGQLRVLSSGWGFALELNGWPAIHGEVGWAGEGTFTVECEGTPVAWVTKHPRHWDITIGDAAPHCYLLTTLSLLYPGVHYWAQGYVV